jgi:hypothetical protein
MFGGGYSMTSQVGGYGRWDFNDELTQMELGE